MLACITQYFHIRTLDLSPLSTLSVIPHAMTRVKQLHLKLIARTHHRGVKRKRLIQLRFIDSNGK
ncbi:unnamed protein product [Brassica oleracea]